VSSLEDLSDTVKTALRQLGADKQLVPGAKLKYTLDQSFLEPHFLDELLKARRLRFSDFILGIPGIVVQKRGGADMLVGFPNAQWPISATSSRSFVGRMQLRTDVYTALTKVSTAGFFYMRETDRFVEGPVSQASGVPFPKVTFSDLTAERKKFAEELEDQSVGKELLDALEQSTNPLSAFQRAIDRLNLGGQWHVFKFRLMRAKLDKWAEENQLAVLPSWYDYTSEPEVYGPKAVMVRLVDHMTEEEIRSMSVPFRAVESLFNSISRRV